MNFPLTERLTELNNAFEKSLISDNEYKMIRTKLFDVFTKLSQRNKRRILSSGSKFRNSQRPISMDPRSSLSSSDKSNDKHANPILSSLSIINHSSSHNSQHNNNQENKKQPKKSMSTTNLMKHAKAIGFAIPIKSPYTPPTSSSSTSSSLSLSSKPLPPPLLQTNKKLIDSFLEAILKATGEAGYSAQNVAFGMGGGLLQKLNRDTMSFATKLSHITYADGTQSLPGEFVVKRNAEGIPIAYPKESFPENDPDNLLRVVYDHGKVFKWDDFDTIRKRVAKEWPLLPPKFDNISPALKLKVDNFIRARST
ncbi:14803_t:CDS:2 [Entrophospora sp. SA101]|nr:14803_t:CDS:2 [Entrophospora sp. SA101]